MRHAALVAALVAAVAACAPPGPAPDPYGPPTGAIRQRVTTERAVVQAVNPDAREVLLLPDEGEAYAVILPEDEAMLEGLSRGDVLIVERYRDLVVAPAGAQAPQQPRQAGGLTIATDAAGRPEARSEADIDESAVLVSYDAAEGAAVLDVYGGGRRLVDVTPELQAFFARLEPGDRIELAETERTSVSVLPAS